MNPADYVVYGSEVAIKSKSPHEAGENGWQYHWQKDEEFEYGSTGNLPVDCQSNGTTYRNGSKRCGECVNHGVPDRQSGNRVTGHIKIVFESDKRLLTRACPFDQRNTQ